LKTRIQKNLSVANCSASPFCSNIDITVKQQHWQAQFQQIKEDTEIKSLYYIIFAAENAR